MRCIRPIYSLLIVAAVFSIAFTSQAQTKRFKFVDGQWVEQIVEKTDTLADAGKVELQPDTTIDVSGVMLPLSMYLPTVFCNYDMNLGQQTLQDSVFGDNWAENVVNTRRRANRFNQRYMLDNAGQVRYNISTLPEAPKKYVATVDPTKASITVEEIAVTADKAKDDVEAVEVKKRNWLHDFQGLVQFSQAYNSPNWYQGGNNNLNMIVNAVWSVKLNPAFNSKLLFENTVSYKLAMNSAPDDSLRNYSISEDLFQINTKFGLKARKHWYYSMTMQFKTQLLNNYKKNTQDLSAAFLSPGELNLGLGMTYSTTTKKCDFNASLAPFSYNLKTCVNSRMNPETFGIKPGKKTVSQIGSNIDCKLVWKMSYNITFTSRLTAFTNYDYVQSDWENTLAFTINKFLSTQVYVHLRYDSQGARFEDSNWRKWQVKEILSFGFSYKIGTV